MSVDLTNEDGDKYKVNNITWARILTLARVAGWQPIGTVAPKQWNKMNPDEAWDPADYWTNSGQFVQDKDARALGEALDRALPHVPETVPGVPNKIYNEQDYQAYMAMWQAVKQELFENFFSEQPSLGKMGWLNLYRSSILNLARYCRQGGFTIT